MKNNRSLAISTVLNKELKKGTILGIMENYIPDEIFEVNKSVKTRDRVFSPKTTLETMLLSATLEDKSLTNAVNQYYIIHQKRREILENNLREEIKKQKQEYISKGRPKGRPRKFKVELPKSKVLDISLNTAAYSKARKRLPIELTQSLFTSTKIENVKNAYSHWHNYPVLITDGTYLQLQDTSEIKEEFPIKNNSGSYPQALLEVLIVRGTGQLFDYKISNRMVSELKLFNELIDTVPKGYLILMDDLYNSYEILNKLIAKGIEFVVPAKRKRNYRVIEVYEKGDEIIEISKPKTRGKIANLEDVLKPKLTLRKIDCISPDGKKYVLFTSILDKNIDKTEIQSLYLTRWDIEITIREIKTIMGINILRSKTPEMLKKELNVSLSAYNIIRKIIYASIKDLPFSPEKDFIFEFYTLNKNILIDKKGRVYKKWSTGRKRTKTTNM